MIQQKNLLNVVTTLALTVIFHLGPGSHQVDGQFFTTGSRIELKLRSTTLNYVNVTGDNVTQTVSEQPNNEKNIEFGDIDKDGDIDVVVAVALSDFQSRRNKLYLNNKGVLKEVSGSPIISRFSTPDVTRNAFLRDYDKDGWLDLIIVNDSNNGDPAGITRCFLNQHPAGVFSHFDEQTTRLGGATGAACSAVSLDLDGNGTDDLYLGNYPFNSQDTYYINDGSANFTEVTSARVPPDSDYTVDVSSADMNGDGKVDLLVSNHFDPNFIYYNNNQGGGSGLGDFSYDGSTQAFSTVSLETAMAPGDFNQDGLMDIYYSNRGPGRTDKIFQNNGNDSDHKATFTEIPMPPSVSATESRKADVADLDHDGKLDIIVMGENRRPVILRNTSVNGEISYVDWTPAPAFPAGNMHAGWHAAAFDSNGNKKMDILVGGTNDDHLFVRAPSSEHKDASLKGQLPDSYNLTPLAILGKGGQGEIDSFVADDIPAGAMVSVILRSNADVILELRNSSGDLIASSNRGGIGVEEALQISAPGGDLRFNVITNQPVGKVGKYMLEVLSRDG